MGSISTHPETNAHGRTTCSRLSYGLTMGGGSSVLVYHTPSGGPRHTEWPWAHVWAHIFWEDGNRMRWKSKREGKSWSKGQGKGFHGWHSYQQVVADKERHSKQRGQAGIGLYSGHWNHSETGVEWSLKEHQREAGLGHILAAFPRRLTFMEGHWGRWRSYIGCQQEHSFHRGSIALDACLVS